MPKILEKMKSVRNGGIEAFVFKTTALITDSGSDIRFYSDNPPETDAFEPLLKKQGRSICAPEKNRSSIAFKPLRIFLRLSDFVRFCRKEHFDIIHIHMSRPFDVMYGAAAKLSGKSRIILHSHFSERTDRRLFEKQLNVIFRKLTSLIGDIFIACSENAAEYMFDKAVIKSRRYIVIPNGISLSDHEFDEAKREQFRKRYNIGSRLLIGNIGRLSPEKNQSFLLKVFAEIKKLVPDSALVIAGGGDLEASLRDEAHSLGIGRDVIFTGFVSGVQDILSAMDIFVFPSLFEGLGMAAVEAQAAGLPVVCSDAVPSEAAVTELCSFMPLKAEPKQWAEHIISKAYDNERRSYSEEIRAAGYDIVQTASQLEKLYRV